MTSDEDKSHLQQQYEQWITDLGSQIGRPSNPNVFSEIVYSHPNGMSVSIVQPNDQSDRIVCTTRLNIPPDVQQTLIELPEEQRGSLMTEIQYGLLQMGIQFGFSLQNNIIQAIAVERTVFGESLNKQVFFDNLYRVIDGLVFVQTKLREKLGSRMGRAANTSAYG